MTATLRPRRLVAPPVNRLVAAAIDLAIIVLPTIAVALIASERFTLIGPDGGPVSFSVVDQARLDEIDAGFHRAAEIGGSLFVLDLAGLAMAAATLTLAALGAHVLFPLIGGGRSPGKAVTGLRVVAADGGPAGAGRYLIRTLAAPIDLLGLGVPGLLGTLVAWGDVENRRLGDRLAETRVSGRPTEWVLSTGSTTSRPADRTSTSISLPPQTNNPAPASPAEQRPSLPWLGAPALTEVPVTIVLTSTDPAVVDRDQGAATLDHTAPTLDRSAPEPSRHGSVHPAPPLPPVRRLDGSPTRSPRSRRGAIRAETETRAATVGSAPQDGWLGGDGDYDTWAAPAGTRPSRERDADLVIDADGVTQPVWDRGRQAWIYRNRDDGRWFRHDEASGRWSPIAPDAEAARLPSRSASGLDRRHS